MQFSGRRGEPDAPIDVPAISASPARDELCRALYTEHGAYVRQRLRRLGIADADLSDVTHDVFVTVHRRLDTFDRARPARPWLFGILFRVAADRRRGRRRGHELIPNHVIEARDPGLPPDEALYVRQAHDLALRALAGLDQRLRTVFTMHDLGGQDAAEIARVLAIPVKTVYTRLRLARARLASVAGGDAAEAPRTSRARRA